MQIKEAIARIEYDMAMAKFDPLTGEERSLATIEELELYKAEELAIIALKAMEAGGKIPAACLLEESERKEEKIKAMAFETIVDTLDWWLSQEKDDGKFAEFVDGINRMTDRIIEEIRDEAKREKAKTTPTENK